MSDFLLESQEFERYKDEMEEVWRMLKSNKKMTYRQMVEEEERRRKTRILDILYSKYRSKKINELYALLRNSPDDTMERPQDVRLDAKKRTALHYIAQIDANSYNKISANDEYIFVIEEVLNAGIDANLKDIDDKTADEYCVCPYLKKMIGDLK